MICRAFAVLLTSGVLATLATLSLSSPLGAQSYVFSRVVDDSTDRPDGKGKFNISGGPTTPSFDGQWVVFREYGPINDASAQAVWSFNTADRTFTKLADFDTPVPGGVGNFKDLQLLDSAPYVKNGTVVFVGRDSNPSRSGIAGGIYSTPAGGGPITKLVDYNTPDPTGGTFASVACCFGQNGGFSFDGKTVAFHGTNTGGLDGVYTVGVDGSSLTMVADVNHPFDPSPPPGLLQRVIHFGSPAITGSNVVVLGGTGLDPSNGYNAVYLGMIGGTGAVNEQVTSRQQLPGNSNDNFHTRFDGHAVGADGNMVVVAADDSNSYTSTSHYHGLYTTNLGSHSIDKIVDVNSSLPGLGPLRDVAPSGVSVSQSNVLFLASDTTGARALYLWKDGAANKIIGNGDTLDGVKDFSIMLDPGRGALSGSTFAFHPWREPLYLAIAPEDARLIPTPTAVPTPTVISEPTDLPPMTEPPTMPDDSGT